MKVIDDRCGRADLGISRREVFEDVAADDGIARHRKLFDRSMASLQSGLLRSEARIDDAKEPLGIGSGDGIFKASLRSFPSLQQGIMRRCSVNLHCKRLASNCPIRVALCTKRASAQCWRVLHRASAKKGC